MLEIVDLSVGYEGRVAVHGVSLRIERSEVVALVGRSGSGKTSLLHAIAGILPYEGTVRLDGTSLDGVPTQRRKVGLVFQDFALFPHLDVEGNVGYGLIDHPNRSSAVATALEMVELEHLRSRRIDELSGGEAQRVALARTLATRPDALLLDEPLGSLDPALRGDVAAELRSLLDTMSIPTILVTHDTSEAFALGDRIAVLTDGELVRLGTPSDVWHDPQHREVARILGHTSIVETHVHQGVARVEDVHFPVASTIGDGPRTLVIKPDAASRSSTGLELEVASSSFVGPGWTTWLALGTGRISLVTERRLDDGEMAVVSIDPAGIVEVR